MNRATYYALRSAARSAQRTWWLTMKDIHASPIHRASAMDNASDAMARVPGGVSLPTAPPVLLPGWYSRRYAVLADIRNRRARASVAAAADLMSERFAPVELRAAA